MLCVTDQLDVTYTACPRCSGKWVEDNQSFIHCENYDEKNKKYCMTAGLSAVYFNGGTLALLLEGNPTYSLEWRKDGVFINIRVFKKIGSFNKYEWKYHYEEMKKISNSLPFNITHGRVRALLPFI